MATSGSTNFAATRNQILRQAALKVNALPSNATMSATMLTDMAFGLNAMVKAWQGGGIHIWTIAEGVLFPAVDQVKYGLGTGATDHATETYYETAITADEAAGQTVISVDSTANMTVADNIGICLDDGSIQWTTISSKTSTTVTVAAALTDSAAEDQPVFNYTTRIVRPLKIKFARRYNISDARDTPIKVISRQEYYDMPKKTDPGPINSLFYDPLNNTGYLYHWNAVDPVEDLIKFTFYRPIEDFDAAADNPDLPQDWISALVWNFALDLSAEYPVSDAIVKRIASRAAYYLDLASSFDREAEDIHVQPDFGP